MNVDLSPGEKLAKSLESQAVVERVKRSADKPFVSAPTFRDIVNAASHAHREAPATTDEDAIQEISEHLEMIGVNISDGDADWAKLWNLAYAAAAVDRYAQLLMSKVSEKRVRKIIAEIQE